ncbi:electron transfer flavoprotein subunit beta/FixA family protein [Metabacillus litoralis]|uniref:electron transfer flavoprotein subunit beta/FixA family protein n=1 Tax=Metabacillus litoralis TaxID=152268 RepID=UPI00203EFE28|nr:electron transfer flavoprotein subunit beta/FixA family protein [Metabacillus litoralis]MCM3160772.1 electron transfer flavoprotein subunit beta/FixA family protein [Metabacillus litoralis]
MNILVIVKETFDLEEKIIIDNNQVNEDGAEFIMNPYDEYAIEEAVRLKQDIGGKVTVATVGADRSEKILRTSLAMGADKAVLLEQETKLEDESIVAKILSVFAEKNEFDLIIGGNMSVDYGSGQIGPRLAEELEIPQVTAVTKLSIEGNSATVVRDVEGDTEVVQLSMPFLMTAQQGLNEPRYPSLPSIMKAKKKPIDRIKINDLGISLKECQEKSKTVKQYIPLEKKAGRVLVGNVVDQTKELFQIIEKEIKVN